jgi:hypothetical protein
MFLTGLAIGWLTAAATVGINNYRNNSRGHL